MRVAPSRFARVMPERRSSFLLEALKPRRIEIASSGAPKPVGQDNVQQIDEAKAA